MAFKKYVKRVGRNIARAVKKRYVRKGKPNVKRIVKDVAFLKSVLNPEKKRYLINNSSNQPLGQISGNSNGCLALDVTPIVSVGAGYTQRNGASIRLHSSYMQFQLYHQSSTTSPIRIKFWLFQVMGNPQSPVSSVPASFLSPNPFIYSANTVAIYDYNSARNPDFMKQYKLIRSHTCTIQPDSLTSQIIVKDVKFGVKYRNYHTRFSQDSNTVTSGQLVLLITADVGNCSTSTTSTLALVPSTVANTGCSINYNILHYYYDN